ncbi:MAG TPA: hypothetical protein VGL87_09870 [Steroidobacteraceae bacterium]
MAARLSGWNLSSTGATIASGAAIALLLASMQSKSQSPVLDARVGVLDARAGAPSAVSVTIYRDPYRFSGSIDLDRLAGFALVTETRTVHLQAGEEWLRFEGVADGIEPESAIVTGLDAGTIEKNRDAAVLSPSALVAAAVGKPVELTRTNPKSGRVERVRGTVLSDAQGGVIFRSEGGIEALRCSGLPETLSFDGTQGLRAHPTLSVRVRAHRELTATMTLSYLAHGFDWAADYTATLSPDRQSMDLGGWVTLANGNGVSFPEAHAQVVAGVVNRESGEVEPLDIGGPIIANCWPRGTTSDIPMLLQFDLQSPDLRQRAFMKALAAPAPAVQEVAVSAQRVQQEQLGDLKLYRIPEATTVASRQSKQVRLLDRTAIPVTTVYGIDLAGDENPKGPGGVLPASRYLRTRNAEANHLGIPLPSGHVQVFAVHQGRPLLEHESNLRDLAVDQEVEIDLGPSSDVQVAATRTGHSHRIEISNARAAAIAFELRLRLPEGMRIVDAAPSMGTKNGRPIFNLTIAAHSVAVVRYRTSGSP